MDTKDTLKQVACDKVDENKSELISLSRNIWENPELAYKEFKSSAILTDFLNKHNFKV